MALGEVLARLSVELGLDTAAFTTGSRKAQREAKDVGDKAEAMGRRIGSAAKSIATAGAAVAGAFILSQIKDRIAESLEYASSLGETAQQLGVTAKALQEYRYAASQVGISTEEMDKGLQKFTKTVGLAAAGDKKAEKLFADLGVNIRDANGHIRDAGDILPDFADGVAKLGTSAERSRPEVLAFGKTGQQLDPLLSQGAKGVNALRKEINDGGGIVSDAAITKADLLVDELSKVKTQLEARLSNNVGENAGDILELVKAFEKLVAAIDKADGYLRRFNRFMAEYQAKGRAEFGLTEGVRAAGRADMQSLGIGPKPVAGSASTPSSGGALLRLAPKKPSNVYTGIGARPAFNPFGKFAEGSDQLDAGRNTQALAALTRMSEAATAAGQRAAPVLARLAEATGAANDNFARLGPAAQELFEKLFPEEARQRQFGADYAAGLKVLDEQLRKGTISAERYQEAVRRLFVVASGGDVEDGIDTSALEEVDSLAGDAVDHILGDLDRFSDRADETSKRTGESFATMAQNVIRSLGDLGQTIKHGGFLDILSAALNLGLQLGGAGVFGKSFQNKVTGAQVGTPPFVPGFANGTGFAPGGPELVRLPRGSAVYPNGTGPGGGASRVEVVPSRYFDVVVDGRIVRNAPALMYGGARLTEQRFAKRQRRALA